MNPQAKQRLLDILAKDDSAIEEHDLRFLRARAAYLSPDQLARLNKMIKASGLEGLTQVSKSKLPRVEVQPLEIIEKPVQKTAETPDEEDGEPTEPGDEEDVVDDEPEDNGELELVEDDVPEDDEDATDPDEEAFDVDEMNLEQLKVVAKELGIAGSHFYKDEAKLREKILATYKTSNEAQAESEADETSEIV